MMSDFSDDFLIQPLEGPETDRWLDACAEMMSTTEPWTTLKATFTTAREKIAAPNQEAWIVLKDDEVAGFMLLMFSCTLRGYLRTICLAPKFRGQGLGTKLIAFAEERIFRDHPNVFLCVSSFNPDARRFYERLGYEYIGELKDYIVAGHSELLHRKTRGPLTPG